MFASVVVMVTDTASRTLVSSSAASSRPASRAASPAAPPPVDVALGLLALAIDVCADEVARLLARPTPSTRRPGPVVRIVGPGAGLRPGFAPARDTS
jgi:hypothetical protein